MRNLLERQRRRGRHELVLRREVLLDLRLVRVVAGPDVQHDRHAFQQRRHVAPVVEVVLRISWHGVRACGACSE